MGISLLLRKIAAILLLLLLSFTWYGYRIVISAMQNNADRRLETIIDKSQYDESQLIEMRVPLNIPYQHRFTEYERFYGEIEIDGKSYTYVKRKMEGDVMILQCIPNKSKEELKAINNDWSKMNAGADINQPSKQQQSFAKDFWSEYDGEHFLSSSKHLISLHTPLSAFYFFYIPQVMRNTPHQPPEC